MTLGRSVTVLLLAGSRPGTDPLAEAFGAEAKALVPIEGEAMLSRVAKALLAEAEIKRIILLAQRLDLIQQHADTSWLVGEPRVAMETASDSVSASVSEALDRHEEDYPFLVTTADHPLLTGEMVRHFVSEGMAAGTDLAVGLVERKLLDAAYPGNRRTWMPFRGGSYSGANLFLLATPKVRRAIGFWQGIEHQRKKARAIMAAFGPFLFLGIALKLLNLRAALRIAARRLGLTAVPVELPWAEACIDVDKPSDHALASRILAERRP